MIVKVLPNGISFRLTAHYCLHDKDGKTAERVAWTYTQNVISPNPHTAWKEMAFTALDATLLKKQAGRKVTRPIEKPVLKMIVSWDEADKPTQEHMRESVKDLLKFLKLSDYQAFFVAHNDQPRPHVHVTLNRVHPEIGIVVHDGYIGDRAQKWCHQYELKHGIRCPQRHQRQKDRERGQKPEPYRDTVITEAWQKSDNGKSFQAALAAKGYRLARGRKRIVVVDRWGKAQNPARRLGIREAVFNARIADLDPQRLPLAGAVQREAKQQAKREYLANRKWEKWKIHVITETSIRHTDDIGKAMARHSQQSLARKEELEQVYKITETKEEIARLKRELDSKNLLTRLNKRHLEQKLEDAESRLKGGMERIQMYMSEIDFEYEKARADLAKKHATEDQRIMQTIESRKPEFYREEVNRAHSQAPARDAQTRRERQDREREQGYER